MIQNNSENEPKHPAYDPEHNMLMIQNISANEPEHHANDSEYLCKGANIMPMAPNICQSTICTVQ
jgi:hypothetical protein